MSGIIGSRLNIKGSGLVAKLGTDGQVLTSAGIGVAANYEDLAGGISWQSVVTGSTLTAVAGNGYPIDTSSNACTITLPASASAGDEIIFKDYARNWATNKIIIDSNGLKYQGDPDTYTVEYTTAGQSLHIVYADATKGWIPISDDDVADVPSIGNTEGIFGYGDDDANVVSMSNKISDTGVVATDVSGVGTTRYHLAACEYGGDKGLFGYGLNLNPGINNMAVTNLVSTTGVISTDTSGVGSARRTLAACSYGTNLDKGIFGFGYTTSTVSMTNLISNTGVAATDTTGVGTARHSLAACEYGLDKGIFGFGNGPVSTTNLVSNTGVVATDTSGVGTGKFYLGACSYGGDKGIFGFGNDGSITSATNLVSSTGVVSTDTSGVGTARQRVAATQYGGGKALFGYGHTGSVSSLTNLISGAGVVATDTTGVGTARAGLAACSFN